MRHSITKISAHQHGGTYKVSIRIPCEKGWISDVKLHIFKFSEYRQFDMQFVKEAEMYAYFETLLNSVTVHYTSIISLFGQEANWNITKKKIFLPLIISQQKSVLNYL